MRLLALFIATFAVHAAPHHHHQPAPNLGPLQSHRATVYSGHCDGQSNSMADGTHLAEDGQLYHRGRHVDIHALASSFLPLGTRIRFARKVFGSTDWTVRDSGGAFDLYRPNCNYSGWPGLNNLVLYYRVILR